MLFRLQRNWEETLLLNERVKYTTCKPKEMFETPLIHLHGLEVTRVDSQRRSSVQHSAAMLEQCCNAVLR